MQRLAKIFAETAAPKVPEYPSYGHFGKVTQNPHFLKKCKGGTKENFSKIAQKGALVWKAKKDSGANRIILWLVCISIAKTGENFGGNSGSKSTGMSKLWIFSQGHPKPAFSEKVQRGDRGNVFKYRPKSIPPLKGPTALWRKWHYPLISIHLYWKDWKRFLRKRRLQNCPNTQVMGIFARSPQTRIFLESAKGGPRKIFQKSPKKEPSFERPKRTLAQIALFSD